MPSKLLDLEVEKVASVDLAANRRRFLIVKRASKGGETDMNKADSPMKTEDGTAYPASDYAYVPDPSEPSTWKLRLTSEPGGKPDARHVGDAIASISPEGWRGHKADIPAADLANVKARLRSAWKEANPDADESAMPAEIKKVETVRDGFLKRAISLLSKAVGMEADGDMDGCTAVSFAEAYADRQTDEAQWDMTWALRESIDSIIDDDTGLDKQAALKQTLDQFGEALGGLLAQMDAAQKLGVQAAVAKVAAAGASREAVESALEALRGVLKAATPKGAPNMPEDVTKGSATAPETVDVEKAALQKKLEDLEKRAQAAEEIAKAERDARVTQEFVKRAEGYGSLPILAAELGPIMKKAHEGVALAKEEFEKLENVLKAAGAALAKSDLFKAVGIDGDADDSPAAMLKVKTDEIRKADPSISVEKARTKAFEQLPADVQTKLMAAPVGR